MSCPAGIRPERWQEVIVDADRFLRDWSAQAAALGWSTLDIFGCHPTHPIQRLDCAGLTLLLHGHELLAITADTARTRRPSRAILTYYRRLRPGAVPLWELGLTRTGQVAAKNRSGRRWLTGERAPELPLVAKDAPTT